MTQPLAVSIDDFVARYIAPAELALADDMLAKLGRGRLKRLLRRLDRGEITKADLFEIYVKAKRKALQ